MILRRLGPALLLPGLLCIAGFCIAGCGTQAQNTLKVQEYLDESGRHVQTDPTDAQARQWADRAVAVAPSSPDALLGSRTPPNAGDPLPQLSVAAVFAAAGDNPALADYMAKAVKKFPDDERGYQLLDQAQGTLGRTAAQKATAAQLAALLTKKMKTPGATDIRVLTESLAQAYFDAGDPVSGAATYKKALQAYPTEPDPANGLAYADAVRGTNLPEALALARKAVALAQKQGVTDTSMAAIQDTLGWVQYQQGSYAEAEQNLLQAVDADPRRAEMRYHLGLVYAAEGKMEAARAELSHAVELSQGYAAAQQALAGLPKTAAPTAVSPNTRRPKPTGQSV